MILSIFVNYFFILLSFLLISFSNLAMINKYECLKVMVTKDRLIKIDQDFIVRSRVLRKYVKFLKDFNSKDDNILDYCFKLDNIDQLISLFNKIKHIKASAFDRNYENLTSKLIIDYLTNCEENLTNGLKAINLVEFLNINDLFCTFGKVIAELFNKDEYLLKFINDFEFFNNIYNIQAPYIKKLAGLCLINSQLLSRIKLESISENYPLTCTGSKLIGLDSTNNLLFLSKFNDVNVIDLNNLETLQTISLGNKVRNVAFNSEYNLMALVLKNNSIVVFKKENDKYYKVLKNKLEIVSKDAIKAIKINRDNRYLAAMTENRLYLFDLEMDKLSFDFIFNVKLRSFIEFDNDNSLILANNSGQIMSIKFNLNGKYESDLNNFESKDIITSLDSVELMTLHSNGKHLAIYSKDEEKIFIWDIKEHKQICQFPLSNVPRQLIFSCENTNYSYLIVIGCNGQLTLFDLYTRQKLIDIKVKQRSIVNALSYNYGDSLILFFTNGVLKKIDLSTIREFIFNNDHFFEYVLLLINISQDKNFDKNLSEDYIKNLLQLLPNKIKKMFNLL